jgi:hypothetical protein
MVGLAAALMGAFAGVQRLPVFKADSNNAGPALFGTLVCVARGEGGCATLFQG